MKNEGIIKTLGIISFLSTIYGINMISENGIGLFNLPLTIISILFLAKFIKMDKDLRKSKTNFYKNSCNTLNSLPENSEAYFQRDEFDCNEDDDDIELWIAFENENSEEIHKRINTFEECRDKAYEESDLGKRIELLKQTIVLYDEAKKWFYKTKGGKIYFDVWYEHLHNSKNDDFSYIDDIKDNLRYYNFKKNYIIPTIIQTIADNKDILQKDLYQFMPEIDKYEIQQVIRELEQEDVIKRTKKNSTYMLELTNFN